VGRQRIDAGVTAFGTGFLLSLSLCLDLGLVNVAVLRLALERGGRAAFLVGFGSGLGDLVYFTAALLGVAALLAWPPLRWGLWLGGTAVLIVLAVRMLREARRPHELRIEPANAQGSGSGGSGLRLVGWGAALALASPSAILWFAAVGGSVVAAAGGRRSDLLPFAAGFFAAGIVWSALLAWGAGLLRRALGERLRGALALASAVLFAALAVWVFVRGLLDLVGAGGTG
jgi:L-lysine exporter family protein LysE/ArgO